MLWLLAAFLVLFSSASYADNCSTWRSPQKVWFNEYFFGSGGSAPPNFLEVYSTSNAFPASWQNWSVDVYSAANTKTTYPLTNSTATACTVSNKTWLTSNVTAGLRQQNALVVLKDNVGKYVDAFVFDNSSPPAPWPGTAASSWFPGLADSTTGCPALSTALQTQAGTSGTSAKQANMLVLQNYGNKDMARDPDGGSIWDLTSNTGAGTTYTQCVSNNTNFTKTVDNGTPTPGSTVTFTLNLANTGTSSLSGIQIIDYLPPVLTYISATPSNPADPAVTLGTYSTTNTNTDPVQTVTSTTVTWTPEPVAAGTISKLNIKMQVPADATPGHNFINTAQTTAGLASNQTDFANITIGSNNTPSFAISVSPASATTCTPALLGPKVVITAMSAANGGGTPLTTYNGTVTLTASTPNPKWYNSAGTLLSGNTVTLVNGTVTLYLTDAVAETFTVSAIDAVTFSTSTSTVVMQGSSGNITFTGNSVGMALTDVDTLSPSYGAVAGRPHAVRATISNCGSAATTVNGTYSGTIYYVPGLNHPTGAAAPTVNTSAASCPGGVSLPLTSTGSTISLPFASGVTTFYLCSTDVGQYGLSLKMNSIPSGNSTVTVTGVSSNFTVRPFVITGSNFVYSATNNPAGGSAFTAAGNNFSGTLTAWRWLSTADDAESPRGNGIPDTDVTASAIIAGNPGVTASFSGTTNNAGVVSLAPVIETPVGGTLGTLSPTTATLSTGTVALSNAFNYSEVGSISLGNNASTTYASTNYLGAASLNVPILSDVIGRFTPHHFVLTLPTLTTRSGLGCTPASTFTYMDEPFQLTFTLTAQNTGNATTQNYQGTLAFLNPATAPWVSTSLETAESFGLGAINASTDLSARLALSGTPGGTGWSNGTNTITANVILARALNGTLPTGPYEALRIGIAPQDADNVKTTGLNLDADSSGTSERVLINAADTSVRFGRLRLFNAFGNSSANLNIPVQAQFWTGKSWLMNNNDSCTPIPATAVGRAGYVDKTGATTTAWIVTAAAVPNLDHGQGTIVLTKNPTAGAGSVNICVDLGADPVGGTTCAATSVNRNYLQGMWAPGANFDNDPSARATFGVYSPETRRSVHIRELF
jgi:uncharacterized repeat protein (TIGR01451 family)